MSSNYQYGQYGAGRPYGDVFSVQTPHLDLQSQHLWQDHLLRQQQERQDSKELDDLMRSEVGKIRSADTGDFINAWQKYKLAKQPLYNPKVQLSPQEINRINQEANVHLAHAMQIGNQSVQAKEDAKQLIAERKSRPVAFAKDFNNRIEAYMNTPLEKLNMHPQYGDLTDRDSYYSKANISDLQPLFTKSKGTLHSVGQTTRMPLDKLHTKVTSYQGYASPLEYYRSVVGGLKGEDMQSNFLNNYHFTPEEEQNITDQYNEKVLNNPQYAEAYGTSNLQFPDWADATPTGRTAKLMAMEHGLIPLVKTDKREINDDAKMVQQDKYTMKHIYYMATLKDADVNHLATTIRDAIPKLPVGEDGGVDVTPMFQGVKVTGLPTGKTFGATNVTYYPKTKQITYTDVEGNKRTKSYDDFRKDVSTINTVQDLKVVDALGKSDNAKLKSSTTETYFIKGKNYSHSDLLKMGYSEDDIKNQIAPKYKKH